MRFIFALLVLALAGPVSAQVHVRGYVRKDGTYVAPHERTAPNSTKLDNYSTRGNYNPYTGKEGTKSPDPVPYVPRYSPYTAPLTTPPPKSAPAISPAAPSPYKQRCYKIDDCL